MIRFRQPGMTKWGKRHKPGEMNQTECEYAELLQSNKLAGQIEEWFFEAVTFRIANDCRYTPDFCVYFASGAMEFVDVKGTGPIDEKSTVKIKTCAEKFPMFRFVQAKKRTKKEGGGFRIRKF